MLLRSPFKILKPYDNPSWGFEQRYEEKKKKKKRLITKNSGLPKLLRWSHVLRSDQFVTRGQVEKKGEVLRNCIIVFVWVS
jgi:hypothetical protein